MSHKAFDLILFDLGGVLVELGGVERMRLWMDDRLSASDMWERWLSSKTVRAFESGQTDAEQFALDMIDEFTLPVSAERFLFEFNRWLKHPYPGAARLLAKLSNHYTLGVLSNTNELHWSRIAGQMGLISFFDWVWPSHLTGHLKPDAEAFVHVLETTGLSADRILFFDDNRLNTDAASKLGFCSQRVSGVSGVVNFLDDLER